MFKQALLKLALLYSILFLILFWVFSSGLYVWMNNSFGEGYISQIQQRKGVDQDAISKNTKVVTIAGDVALDQLKNILIILNSSLLFIIPIFSWFLARRTLSPLQVIHEQQKQFISDASHEMRTPLSIVSGEIEVALNKKRTVNEYKKTLVSTKEETDRLSILVESLLFLAQTDKKIITSFDPVDVTDLLSSIVNSLQLKSDAREIQIRIDVQNVSSPIVKGNSDLLRQLFYNLIDNALIYTSNKGGIAISLSQSDNNVAIAITDTGIGIHEKDQQKILERFYRVDSSRSQTKGYGLGLAIVLAILKKHQGKLKIRSKVNKGSTFTVFLPKF